MTVKTTLMCIGGEVIRHTLDVFVSDGRIHFDLMVPVPDIAHVYGADEWKLKYRGFLLDSAEVAVQAGKDKRIFSFITDGVPRPLFIAVVERFPHARFVMYSVSDDGLRTQMRGHGGQLTHDSERTDPEIWNETADTRVSTS